MSTEKRRPITTGWDTPRSIQTIWRDWIIRWCHPRSLRTLKTNDIPQDIQDIRTRCKQFISPTASEFRRCYDWAQLYGAGKKGEKL